jgi:hypothetical protein
MKKSSSRNHAHTLVAPDGNLMERLLVEGKILQVRDPSNMLRSLSTPSFMGMNTSGLSPFQARRDGREFSFVADLGPYRDLAAKPRASKF